MLSSDSQTSHVQTTILIQLIALCLFTAIVNGATNPGDNGAEFKAMCQLVKLATLKPEDAATDQDALRDQEDLNVLNLTVADAAWKQNLSDGDKPHKLDNVIAKYDAAKHASNWQQQWSTWLSIAPKKKAKESDEKFKTDYAAPKSGIARRVAAAQFAKYTEETASLRSAYDAAIGSLNTADKIAIVTHLTKALYKKDGTPDEQGEVPKQKVPDAARTQNNCKGRKVGDNIRYDLMCLCAGMETVHSTACTTTALAKAWVNTAGEANAAADAIIAKCKEGTPMPLEAAAIEAVVQTLQSLIGIHADGNNKVCR
uniref:Variant surface glycoprotein 1730 n=1 Tax=Trypanosoma brucei TaxID=5691 RepID=M4SW53_9TRYP|nr:variant surface glycoprotein 1730 [Trypanosoma brucei]